MADSFGVVSYWGFDFFFESRLWWSTGISCPELSEQDLRGMDDDDDDA